MIKNLFEPGICILWAILAVVCLGYSLIVLSVRSGTFSFAIWIGWGILFSAFYCLAHFNIWRRIPLYLQTGIVIFFAFIFIVFTICQICILSHFFDKGKANLDYIIVLGAQMRENGPSVVYRKRLDAAYDYLMENDNTVCIVTGGKGNNELLTEGEGGRDYLLERGIPEERIIVEKRSRDTVENIKNSLAIIDEMDDAQYEIGIVTNGFHLFRGMKITDRYFKRDVYGIAADMNPLYIPNNLMRENFGIIRDFINGDIRLN
ncbi:YdcF family protein [Lachnospiraceae bacterium C1.1]|nr:YdcF family protein [Lachnospiraceae bacterium C1.1]